MGIIMEKAKFDFLIIYATITVIILVSLPWATRFILNSKKKPRKYLIVISDVYGKIIEVDGIRTKFRNRDVAWSYARFYKERFPLYNFGVIRDSDVTKQPLVRYV